MINSWHPSMKMTVESVHHQNVSDYPRYCKRDRERGRDNAIREEGKNYAHNSSNTHVCKLVILTLSNKVEDPHHSCLFQRSMQLFSVSLSPLYTHTHTHAHTYTHTVITIKPSPSPPVKLLIHAFLDLPFVSSVHPSPHLPN